MKKSIKTILGCCHRSLFAIENKLLDIKKVLLLSTDISENELNDIKDRLNFYCPTCILERSSLNEAILSRNPIITFGNPSPVPQWMNYIRTAIFNIDYRSNPADSYEWRNLASICSDFKLDREKSKEIFVSYVSKLRKLNLPKSYIFGTGPSLEKALERDWSDGYRIVCNTIVRDPILWNHISPHFIAAADPNYHFGHTLFAKRFRKDLSKRMQETETYFIYPEGFHPTVLREFDDFTDRIIPIPIGKSQEICNDLTLRFEYNQVANILPLLLLPLACTLSKDIYLWGFDGRAPDDKYFWSNSIKHNYPELMADLRKFHPAVFNRWKFDQDPYCYVKNVHGTLLDECLCMAEEKGFKFHMMHKSWTPTLQKRFQEMKDARLSETQKRNVN
jgi:hypothetical protein